MSRLRRWKSQALNFYCKNFFTDKRGPHFVQVMKGNSPHWMTIVKDAAQQVQQQASRSTIDEQEKQAFVTPQKANKKEGTVRARDALKRKAEDVEARVRRVKI